MEAMAPQPLLVLPLGCDRQCRQLGRGEPGQPERELGHGGGRGGQRCGGRGGGGKHWVGRLERGGRGRTSGQGQDPILFDPRGRSRSADGSPSIAGRVGRFKWSHRAMGPFFGTGLRRASGVP